MSENSIGQVARDAYMQAHGVAPGDWEFLEVPEQERWHKVADAVAAHTLSETEGDRAEVEAAKSAGEGLFDAMNQRVGLVMLDWNKLRDSERSMWHDTAANFLAWCGDSPKRAGGDSNPFEFPMNALVHCDDLPGAARIVSRADHGKLRGRTYTVVYIADGGAPRSAIVDESDLYPLDPEE